MKKWLLGMLGLLLGCHTPQVLVKAPEVSRYSQVECKIAVKNCPPGTVLKAVTPSGREEELLTVEGGEEHLAELSLERVGENLTTIVATTPRGIRVETKVRTVFQLPKIFAVVVGISRYRDPAYRGKAPFARNDALAFYRYLVDYLGVDKKRVILLTDEQATVQAIRHALWEKLLSEFPLGKDDLVFLYFAGLGAAEPLPGRQEKALYLICHDTRPGELYASALSHEEFLRVIGEKIFQRVKRLAVFLDTSFEQIHGLPAQYGRQRAVTPPLGERGSSRGEIEKVLVHVPGARGMAVVLPHLLSYDDPTLRHKGLDRPGAGAFTYYLLRGLRGEGTASTIHYKGYAIVTVDGLQSYLESVIDGNRLPAELRPYVITKGGPIFVGVRKE